MQIDASFVRRDITDDVICSHFEADLVARMSEFQDSSNNASTTWRLTTRMPVRITATANDEWHNVELQKLIIYHTINC